MGLTRAKISRNESYSIEYGKHSAISSNGRHSGAFFKPEKNLEFFKLKNAPEMPSLVSLSD